MQQFMKIRFWGTRGSIPSPGPSTVRYGGNTSCVEVRLRDDTLLILDAGTGIRALGATLESCRATILLTHYHWDHIQGLPFFQPAYDPSSVIRIFGPEFEGTGPERYIADQMIHPYFPAVASELAACRDLAVAPSTPFTVGAATIRTARVSHPGVTLGYRVEEAGRTLVYISDNEPDLATPEQMAGMLQLAAGADILLHDCQYFDSEYSSKRGWGHSTPRQAVRLARAAEVRHLVLFHHDPAHTDQQIETLASQARGLAAGLRITVAGEGDTLDAGESTSPRVATDDPGFEC